MATRLRIIKAQEFIEVTTDGIITISTGRKLLAEIAENDQNMGDRELLVDFRSTESRLSITDLYQLAAELSLHGATFRRKVALVVTPGLNFDRARFFEICSNNRGFSVNAYTEYEDAMRWILNPKKPDASFSTSGRHI